MRLPILLCSFALALAACSSGDEDEASGFDAALPEFATDDDQSEELLDQGEIAERSSLATVANLAVDGENVDVTDGTCVTTGVDDLPGGFGFQAAVVDGDGSVTVELSPALDTAEIELFLDGALVPVSDATVEQGDEVWQVEGQMDDADGRVLVTFGCPSDFEERFIGPTGDPDVSPDPEGVSR